MQLPVTFSLKYSPRLAAAVCSAHAVALLGLTGSGLAPVAGVPLGILLTGSLATFFWRQVARLPVRALVLKADGSLEVDLRDSRRTAASIDPGSTVFPWLIVLRARVDERWVSLILPPDALAFDNHRQLRLWLRWRATCR